MKNTISSNKRKAKFSLILIIAILIQIFIPILTKSDNVYAELKTCGDGTTFKNLMDNANDGDVIKVTNNFSCGSNFKIKNNCLVTLDLNNYKITFNINDAFDIGANSALLVKNGTLDKLDTAANPAGIIILDGVTISSNVWLGYTLTWVINNSRIATYSTEYGSINSGVSSLHPIGSGSNGSNYNYENSTPAMIGSGTNWTVNSDLAAEFNAVNNNSAAYNNILLLKNSSLASNAEITASNIVMDFSEYALTTGDYFKISNNSGTNIIRNGTIDGNIDMRAGSGNVSLSNMNVIGTIYNETHTISISSGTYNNISTGTGKITITDGYFKGNLAGNSYEISGGYFIEKPNSNYLKEGYKAIPCNVTSAGTTYKYHVVQGYTVTFNENGHGIAPENQEIEKGKRVTKPNDLVLANYTFEGWYKESECTTAYDFDTAVNSDITLYAKWKLNIITENMVSISNNTETYDGTTYSINVTNSSDTIIKYGTTDGTYNLDEPPKYKDVGTYIIYYKATKDNYVDRTGSATLIINPAIISGIEFEDSTFTYDGEDHTIKVSGELTGGTIKFGKTAANYSLDELPKFKEAGTYTVYYKATKENYVDKIGTAIIKIMPRPLTIKAKDKTITYGDATPIFDYELTSGSVVSGENLSNIYVSQLVETDAGKYTIKVFQTEDSNSNYNITFENGTYTINKKEITPEVTLNQNTFVYNIEEQKPIVSVRYNGKNLPASEYSEEFTEDSTNVGNKQVTITSLNNNYTFTEIIKDYTINAKVIDSSMVTIDENQYVYDAKMKEPVITVKYGDKILKEDEDYEILNTSTLSAKNAGIYNIVLKGKGNYTEEYVVPWAIAKAMISGVEINGVNTTYDGKEHKIDVTIPNNAKISFKTNIDNEYSDEIPKFKDAGNYVVYYKVEVDNNYKTNENFSTVNIAPKEVQVIVDNKDKDYGEDDPKLSYSTKGLGIFEKLEGITLSREKGEDVGTYTIIASKDTSKDTNYNITLNNGTLKINIKEVKKPEIIVTTENIVYTGNEIEPQIVVKDNKDIIIPNSEYTISYSNNINVGKATITVINKDGGNYDVNGSKTFTINPKDVVNAKIEFDQTEYKYTGNKIEPQIVVKDNNTVILSNEYIVSYSNNINEGTATAVITSKKESNYKFNITATFEIVKPGVIQIANSNVPNVNNTKISEPIESLYSKIFFTDEELEQQARGKNIEVYIEVRDISKNILTEDERAIMNNTTGKIGTYIDIGLFKKITGDENAKKITNTKEPISITFEIPENLINNNPKINRTYIIARLNNGTVNILNTTVEDNIITFETDEFSNFTLVYSDDDITTDDVITKINIIDMKKLIGSKSRIVSTRDSYEALSEEQKKLVTNYEILVNAENEYNKLYNQAVLNSMKSTNK